MKILKIHNNSDFSNSVIPVNNVLLFVGTDTNNNPILKYKDSAGEFHTFSFSTPIDPAVIKYNVTVQGVTGTFTGDGDVSSSDILYGKKAYSKGSLITGNIPTVSATLSADTVTVPSGYIASSQTLTVSAAGETTVSGNVVTTPVGYISSQRVTEVGSAIAGTTYTPTSTSYTIPAGSYLNGAIVIEGSEYLAEGNIKKGVTIFNVSGTYEGVVTSDATATAGDILDGKTAYGSAGTVMSGTIPTVSATLSANVTTVPVGYIASSQILTVPEAGAVTSSNLTVTVPVGYIASSRTVTLTDANLVAENIKDGVTIFGVSGTFTQGATATSETILDGYTAYVNGELITGTYGGSSESSEEPIESYFYMPFSTDSTATINGVSVAQTGWIDEWGDPTSPPSVTTVADKTCMPFYGTYLDTTLSADFWDSSCTVTMFVRQTSDGRYGYFAASADYWFGVDSVSNLYTIWSGNGDNSWSNITGDNAQGRSEYQPSVNSWAHLAYVRDVDTHTFQLYLNGLLIKSVTVSPESWSPSGTQYFRVGAWGTGGYMVEGYIRQVRVFDSALTSSEISRVYLMDGSQS